MFYVDGDQSLPPDYLPSHDVTARISSRCYNLICSFLPHDDVYTASQINEHWRRSFADHEPWEGALRRYDGKSGTALRAVLPPSLRITSSPAVWRQCISFLEGDLRVLCRQIQDEDAFFKIVVMFGATPQSLYAVQFPLLLLALHSGALMQLRVEGCGKEGYVVKPKYALLMANTIRWHECSPSEANIPWLLELFAWAALDGPPVYDPTLMLPALSLLNRTLLSVDAVVRILQLTRHMIRRYYVPTIPKLKNESAQQQQQTFGMIQQPSMWLAATPASSVFSVIPLILARYRQHPRVLDEIDHCLSVFDDGRGLDESLRSIAQHIAATELQFLTRREKKEYYEKGFDGRVPYQE